MALEFSKDIIKIISINESNEMEIKRKNLNELFNELSEQINEVTSTMKDFGLGISSLMSSKLLSNGGENFLLAYHCLNNKGKSFLLDYMISLLRLPDYIDKNEARKNLDKKIIKKLDSIREQFKEFL